MSGLSLDCNASYVWTMRFISKFSTKLANCCSIVDSTGVMFEISSTFVWPIKLLELIWWLSGLECISGMWTIVNSPSRCLFSLIDSVLSLLSRFLMLLSSSSTTVVVQVSRLPRLEPKFVADVFVPAHSGEPINCSSLVRTMKICWSKVC